MIVPGLIQGTPQWVDWRLHGVGGSDANRIMLDDWLHLWKVKLGLEADPEANWAMQQGKDLEPIARAEYERQTAKVIEPVCVQHGDIPWLRASLDGISFGGRPVELKFVGRQLHNEAREGHVPEEYWGQVQHILMVTGAEAMDYGSFDGDNLVIVPVAPDPEYRKELFAREEEFWKLVCDMRSPDPIQYTGRATHTNPELLHLAECYGFLLDEIAQAERERDRIKARLIAACTAQTNEFGCIRIVRKQGKLVLDQKALEAAGVNLESAKKRGADYWQAERTKGR